MSDTFEAGMTLRKRGRPSNAELAARQAIVATESDHVIVSGEQLQHWAYRLELAAAMRAGAMDSESRHMEVDALKQQVMFAIAAEMRAL